MAKTLDDTLKVLKRRARKLGVEHAEIYDALDKHYASEVAVTLAELRASKQMSQGELGRLANVQQADVSRILSGRSNPRLATVQKLARAMGAELRVVALTSGRRVSDSKIKTKGASSRRKVRSS